MKFEDKRLMEDKHLTSQIQIFFASEGFMDSLHPSEDLYSFKQWKNTKEAQRSTEIHGSTSACCQPELHQHELHESLGRTRSPPTGDAFKLRQHT